MARCDQCGNDSDRAFRIEIGGRRLTFDSFECAIEMAAPRCEHCDCRIIGHGVEADGRMFCCAHCASHAEAEAVLQRA
jgi:phage terminase large subunit GpA-like protein